MSAILCLRHGVTDWNDDGRFQGHADIPLNASGRDQAAAAASVLAGFGITRVLSSDLSRASQTATIVAAELGLGVEIDSRLREVDVGDWAGLSMAEAGELEPDFWPALREGRDFRRSGSGETATESGERVATALAGYADAAAADDVILAVGHGLSLRVGALQLIGLDYSHARRFAGLRNCHWLALQPGPDQWRLLSYNVGAR